MAKASAQVWDAETMAAHARNVEREMHEEKVSGWINDQWRNILYLNSLENNPTNAEEMLGKHMTHEVFETRLKKLNANLLFEQHPNNPSKRWIFCTTPTGRDFIVTYESGIVPEHSILNQRVEEIPLPVGRHHIDRKDLPKHEFVPGFGYVFDSSVARPGFMRCIGPGSEKKRGWRTVLIYLIRKGIITVAQAEKEFGADNSRHWAAHTGKQNLIVNW